MRRPWHVLSAIALLAPSNLFSGPPDGSTYCDVETAGDDVEVVRPGPDEPPVDDVNWFARPLWNEEGRWLVAFASRNQNYLYDLSSGRRVKIPDRSDAVGTPDGKYMTVPSYYTPDETIRFYDAAVLVDHLDRGVDADAVAPVYTHDHPDMHKVYYQSTAVVSREASPARETTTYRLMFSGTRGEAGFRIVDYRFERDVASGRLEVHPTAPMKLCPEIPNDLNTPFLSKDARHVVSYTSSSPESQYTPGASLRIFRIRDVSPATGTTSCEEVLDLGFAAGKADFSFDGSKLTFHISKGGYLTPFINGGLDAPTVTDVVVVDLALAASGEIEGYESMARITTSLEEGVGSYFPAFFPDGKIFYIFNAVPKKSEKDKRFYFKVADPEREASMANVFADPERLRLSTALGKLWQSACAPESGDALSDHEAPWVLGSLTRSACRTLVEEKWTGADPEREKLLGLCDRRP